MANPFLFLEEIIDAAARSFAEQLEAQINAAPADYMAAVAHAGRRCAGAAAHR